MVVKEEHILLQDQTARHTGGQPDTQVDSQTHRWTARHKNLTAAISHSKTK